VFVHGRDALDGLLNEYSAETNQVRNIAYDGLTGAAAELAGLVIPTGKTVYFVNDYDSATINGNVTVREGAKLVLVGDFAAGSGGVLLVRGQVEVFRNLTVTDDALDVSDYSVENELTPGRNTVIGQNVTILPGATLILDVTDIIPPTENQPNKFTPAQAWAAAGQGNLVIGNGGSTSGTPHPGFADALPLYNYTVTELLTGVSPNASRFYTVTSGRIAPEVLPVLIPQGAFILTRATPQGSVDNTLVVNGSLETQGTLRDITRLEVGPGGSLALAENNGDLLQGLTSLRLGPGATLNVVSPDITLKALESLFLGDGSALHAVMGSSVTFKEDFDLALTLGKNVLYQVGMSPSAVVETVISKDAGLVGASNLIVYEGSTFTVNEGVTFTVDGASSFDISRVTDDDAVVINGAIEITSGSKLIGPDFATVEADPEALLSAVTLGDDGKVVLNHDAIFQLGNVDGVGFVGPVGGIYAYEWTSAAATGPQIEINAGGMVIRDINDIITPVIVSVGGPGAGILKDQSLYLDRGVTLVVDNEAFYLFGDPAGGAKLLGPGRLALGTGANAIDFIGGDSGWQAFGQDIMIADDQIDLYVGAVSGTAAPPWVATFKALGQGAIISLPTASAALQIRAGTTIDLNGLPATQRGEIRLVTTGAEISLMDATSGILTGAANPTGLTPKPLSATGASASSGGPSYTLDSIGVTGLQGDTNALAVTTAVFDTAANKLPVGKLVSLAYGNASTSTIAATAANVVISSQTDTDDI
jgi:hypothetical protein